MEQNPFTGDIQRLENQPTAFRRRVGDWRIFFDVYPEERLVEVTDIVQRTTTTYRGRRVLASHEYESMWPSCRFTNPGRPGVPSSPAVRARKVSRWACTVR